MKRGKKNEKMQQKKCSSNPAKEERRGKGTKEIRATKLEEQERKLKKKYDTHFAAFCEIEGSIWVILVHGVFRQNFRVRTKQVVESCAKKKEESNDDECTHTQKKKSEEKDTVKR